MGVLFIQLVLQVLLSHVLLLHPLFLLLEQLCLLLVLLRVTSVASLVSVDSVVSVVWRPLLFQQV